MKKWNKARRLKKRSGCSYNQIIQLGIVEMKIMGEESHLK